MTCPAQSIRSAGAPAEIFCRSLFFCHDHMAVESQRALQIKARLVKKATFEGAVTELQRWIENDRTFAMSTEAMQLASRCLTLCKSRYTSVVFWKATADLLQV